jgi:hypothetical protein
LAANSPFKLLLALAHVFSKLRTNPVNQKPMNIIEQRKHRIFISTLASIAVVVNASQEVKYARAHPVFRPQFVAQPQPAINPQPPAQSSPAYFPAQRTYAASPPPISSEPAAVIPEESFGQPIAVKEKSAPKPKSEAALVQSTALSLHATNQVFAKEASRTNNLIASTEGLPKKPLENPVEERHEEPAAVVGQKTFPDDAFSHQINSDSQTVVAEIPKAHEIADPPAKDTSPLTQNAPMPLQNNAPPQHHPFAAFFHMVFVPVNAVWQPIKNGTRTIVNREYEVLRQNNENNENYSRTNSRASYHPASANNSHSEAPARHK